MHFCNAPGEFAVARCGCESKIGVGTRVIWDISVEAMRRVIVVALAVVVVGAAAYAIYSFYQRLEEVLFEKPEHVVLDYGRVTAQSRSNPNWVAYPRARRVRRDAQSLEEVELPAGVWRPCQGDCAEAYRRGYMDLGEPAN